MIRRCHGHTSQDYFHRGQLHFSKSNWQPTLLFPTLRARIGLIHGRDEVLNGQAKLEYPRPPGQLNPRGFLPFERNPSAGLPRFNYTLGGFNVFARAIRKTLIFFNERSQARTW